MDPINIPFNALIVGPAYSGKTQVRPFDFFTAPPLFYWTEVALRHHGAVGEICFYWTEVALRQHGATVANRRGRKNLKLVRHASWYLQVSQHWTLRDKQLWQTDKRDHTWNRRRCEDVLCTCIFVLGSQSPIRNKLHKIWRDANFWQGLWISRVQIRKMNKMLAQ